MAAAKLKDFFDADLVRALGSELAAADASFDSAGFVAASLAGLDALELTGRGWHVAEALHHYLPQPFPRAADVIIRSLGPEIPATGNNGIGPLRYMPHVFFVQRYGLDDFEPAMRAQYELTKRFSAESSIRAFIERYPQETLARLREWAGDGNAHVRRLVSEGTRPRLPWAPRLRQYQRDPGPVLALLDLLKDDPALYVRRSVANNLNDIAKDHPDLAVEVARRWSEGGSPERQWIVRHALRLLVKRGHRGALALIGAGASPEIAISGARLDPPAVTLGGQLRFSFTITSLATRMQDLLVEFAVHFVKANGAPRPKVFKLRKVSLPAGAALELSGRVSFADLTTRKHYPGRHRIEVIVNGVTHPLAGFDVAPA